MNLFDITVVIREDRQTTGLDKGVLTSTARVGGH